ncbi:MAG TPA: carbamate kinase [Candidatus Saccharimonadales bacterium]|nr:carbamate kinase [Candidatus Saccharimonadales bacterium]
MSRIVIALGGNALQKDGETSAESQKLVAIETARQLVELIKDGHELVIAHGNGPQVGAILLNEENGSKTPAPLDTCVGMSQGEIGYWLQQALTNELRKQGITKTAATVVTQVVVDASDPAFNDPSKPIGPFYPDEATAKEAAAERQFVVKEDAGRGWRRVVASPQPIDIVEKDIIKQAIAAGNIIIAAGGGGIPVTQKDAMMVGTEAVIDKDFAAEKLAELVEADVLLILTAVDDISVNYRTPEEQSLATVTIEEMQAYVDQGQFAPGSMLPKVQAAVRFASKGKGHEAIVTSPQKAAAALRGPVGTHIKG